MEFETGVTVVGSGAAGLMAAIRAVETCPDTLLVTDGPITRSNSTMAQGGIQVPLDNEASLHSFVDDMIVSARVPVDLDRIVSFAGSLIALVKMLEDWGVPLDRATDGVLLRHTAGGLSQPRIVTAGDRIGLEIVKTLHRVARQRGVRMLAHHRITNVSLRSDGLLLSFDDRGNRGTIKTAAAVVCTGGTSFREASRRGERTTNPVNCNHVLFDILRRLGVSTVHEDYFQYQPFGLTEIAGPVGRCVSGSIAGFGVRLLDNRGKEVADMEADRLTLTQRMLDSGASGRAIDGPNGPALRLTLSDVPKTVLEASFPRLARTLEQRGRLGDDVMVFPFLHYYLGGLAAGPSGETPFKGLFLAGEIVGGMHGKNRLMGNGLTDSLVHGGIAGRTAALFAAGV